MALALEPAGRPIVARGAGLKAVGRLQARGAGTHPTCRIAGAVVATVAELVTLQPPHFGATCCRIRRRKGSSEA